MDKCCRHWHILLWGYWYTTRTRYLLTSSSLFFLDKNFVSPKCSWRSSRSVLSVGFLCLKLQNVQWSVDETTVIHTHTFFFILPGWHTRPPTSLQTVLSARFLKKESPAEQHVNIPEAESGSDYLDETLSDRKTAAVDKIKTHTFSQTLR